MVWNSCASLEVVGSRQRLRAQIVERKPRHPHRRLRHPHFVALDHQLLRRAGMLAGQTPPGLVERGIGLGIGRHIPGRHAGELLQPEIDPRLQPHDLAMPLEQSEERQKQRAIEPVFVQLIGRQVRCRHHDDAEFEQPREQPAEDHGVGDVGHVKFVETQQPGFLGNGGGGALDRVLPRAVLDVLPVDVDALVNVGHEFVEMDAALAFHRAGRRRTSPSAWSCRGRPRRRCKALSAARRPARGCRTANRARTICAPADGGRCAVRARSVAPRARPGRNRPRFFRRQ